MEAPAEPEKKKVELGKPVAENETENTATSANINTSNAIKAPLPGTITSIEVSVGQEVKAGDTVLVESHVGTEVKDGEEKYLVVNEVNILAIVE